MVVAMAEAFSSASILFCSSVISIGEALLSAISLKSTQPDVPHRSDLLLLGDAVCGRPRGACLPLVNTCAPEPPCGMRRRPSPVRRLKGYRVSCAPQQKFQEFRLAAFPR